MKQILGVYSAPKPHWVGDGFPVRSMFSYNGQTQALSPFLMLDYAGTHEFAPAASAAASASIRIAASRPSRSSMRAKSSTATPAVAAAKSARATCSG
jgi:hypothetical protein